MLGSGVLAETPTAGASLFASDLGWLRGGTLRSLLVGLPNWWRNHFYPGPFVPA